MLNKSKANSDEAMVFEPDFVRVKVGDTVRFVPADRNHNAEAMTEIWPEGAEPLKGKLSEEAVLTVSKDGVYGVKCLPHYGLGMVAMIVAGSPDLEKLNSARFPSGRLGKRMATLIEKAKH
jgi:pseudoazurin